MTPSRDELLRIYERTKTIAVVGASASEDKPAWSANAAWARRTASWAWDQDRTRHRNSHLDFS